MDDVDVKSGSGTVRGVRAEEDNMSESTTTADSPRTSRGERTAARLRDAARQVFREHGFGGARVEDIVEVAGVSHGTFYTYYENKSAILNALVDDAAVRLREVVDEPWVGEDVPEVVHDVIRRFVDALGDEGDVISAWIEAAAHDQHFRERLRRVRTEYTSTVAGHLGPALAHTDHDPTVAAGALVAMVEGYTTDRLAAAGSAGREAAVRTLAEIWMGGLLRLSHDGTA